MFDYKKYAVHEIIDYALKECKNDSTDSFLLGIPGQSHVHRFHKTQYPGEYEASAYKKNFYVLDDLKSVVISYISYGNFSTYDFKNHSYSTRYSPKFKTTTVCNKIYKLPNKKVQIDVERQEYISTYDNFRLTQRFLRTGEKQIKVEFSMKTEYEGQIRTRYMGTAIYEKYNKNGLCTFSNFEFYHNGNYCTIQLKYIPKTKTTTFFINSPGNRYQGRVIPVYNFKDASLEQLYDDTNMWDIDLNLSDESSHKSIQFGKNYLKQLLSSEFFSTALEKINNETKNYI